MSAALRLIDANANRAREALRMMEDVARFAYGDRPLVEAIKALRHDLALALAALDPDGLAILSRDTPGDVGATVTAPGEHDRDSLADAATAAGKRLSEALRAIEEAGKTLPHADDAPARVEQLRYRGYHLEQQLARLNLTASPRQWRVCVLLTESLCRHPWPDVLNAALAAGADCIQVREKQLDMGPLLDRVRRVVDAARPAGAAVVVNDHLDAALAAHADGLHLGQTDLPVADARRIAGRSLILGCSTANLDQARDARRHGADYCGVGPMFPTTTKHKPTLAGPAYLRDYLAWGALPHLAIGGVTPHNLPQLTALGCRGVAVSSAACAADDPRGVIERLTDLLRVGQDPIVPAG